MIVVAAVLILVGIVALGTVFFLHVGKIGPAPPSGLDIRQTLKVDPGVTVVFPDGRVYTNHGDTPQYVFLLRK